MAVIIRAKEFRPRGILELHLPADFLAGQKELTFLELITVVPCADGTVKECPHEACTALLISSSMRLGIYSRVLAILLGEEIYDFVDGWCVHMDFSQLSEWQELRISEDQLDHIRKIIAIDYKSVYPLG